MTNNRWKILAVTLIFIVLLLNYNIYSLNKEVDRLNDVITGNEYDRAFTSTDEGFANLLWRWTFPNLTGAVQIKALWIIGGVSKIATASMRIILYDQNTNESHVYNGATFNGSLIQQVNPLSTYDVVFDIGIFNQRMMSNAHYKIRVLLWDDFNE